MEEGNVKIQVVVPESIATWLTKVAQDEDRTVSNVARIILAKAHEKRGRDR